MVPAAPEGQHTALVFVGGNIGAQLVPGWWESHHERTSWRSVAADSGLEVARRLGVAVDAVVGDMDSVDPVALAEAEAGGAAVLRSPPDKDETDLELAIDWVLGRDVTSLVAIGGGGGRLDHLLGNVAALGSPLLRGVTVDAWLGGSYVGIVTPHRPLLLEARHGALLSLLPQHGDVHGVRTGGLRWPLRGDDLHAGSCRGVSNEVVDRAVRVEATRGCLAVVIPDATDLLTPPTRELSP